MDFEQKSRGILRQGSDDGLIAEGSIAFTEGDTLTTEKKTSAITVDESIHPDSLYLLVIDKPAENTAGDLTIKTYNQVKVDGTNARDALHTTHTVEKITSAGTFRSFIVQGLFIGEGTIKLSATFAVDSGAIEIFYKLYRL